MTAKEITDKNYMIGKELYHAAMLIHENYDHADPVLNDVLEKLANAMHILNEISEAVIEDRYKSILEKLAQE